MTAKELMAEGYHLQHDCWVSPTKPMRSAAGWYAGSDCYEIMDQGLFGPMPYDRITTYYATKEEVAALIDSAKRKVG